MCVRARGRESLENASASNHRASNRTRRGGARQPADTIVTGCINPPSWYPQGRASNPEVNALDSHRSPSASSSASSLTSFSEPFPSLSFSLLPFLYHIYVHLLLSRRRLSLSFPSRHGTSCFSRSCSRVRWRISSGHERDVTAINPADTALARVGRASGRLPHFLLLLLSFSLPLFLLFSYLLLLFSSPSPSPSSSSCSFSSSSLLLLLLLRSYDLRFSYRMINAGYSTGTIDRIPV